MSMNRTPWVGFGLQIVPKWRVRIDLARMMTRQLSKRFGHIRLSPGYFFRVSVLVVNLNGDKFLVGIRENKHPGNTVRMREIWASPARFPVSSDHFPEEEQDRYAKDLTVISNEIHAVLSQTPRGYSVALVVRWMGSDHAGCPDSARITLAQRFRGSARRLVKAPRLEIILKSLRRCAESKSGHPLRPLCDRSGHPTRRHRRHHDEAE